MTDPAATTHDSPVQHGLDDPDDTPSSPDTNPRFFDDIAAGMVSRRSVLAGGVATATAFLLGTQGVAVAAPNGNQPGDRPGRGNGSTGTASSQLGFDSVPGDTTDDISVPPGYRAMPFIPWGTPLIAPHPEWSANASNAAADQALQVGMGHDGMHFFPIDGSSTHGLLVLNHEYTVNAHLFPDGTDNWDADKTVKAQHAHGVSVVEVREVQPGNWEVVADSAFNRRVTARTEMTASGPAAGHDLLTTNADPTGMQIFGTVNNCSMGPTPWGTYLTCEENANGYFSRDGEDESADEAELFDRYGYSAGSGYQWHTTEDRWRTSVEPNEPNRFHWIVEIDPFDPDSTPVKRTALGRFKHEGVTVAEGSRRRIVAYSGDDQRGDYIYKFIGNRSWKSYRRGDSPLDDGVLHVAVFHENGTGHWEPLTLDNPKLAGRFADMGELLVKTRLASDLVGATRMDRPEWITVNPDTKAVFCTLTNNSDRGDDYPTDAANPIPNNPDGHIIRWREAGDDHAATTFEWDIFLIAGESAYDPDGTTGITPGVGFGSPDGLWFDGDGRLWIQTDGGQPIDTNNQMLACDPATGDLRRFLVGVPDCEVTGVVTTPDQRTMFVNIQHPGDDGNSDWPDHTGGLPRAATVIVTREDGGIIGGGAETADRPSRGSGRS